MYLYLLGHVFLVLTIFIYNFFTQRMAVWLYAHVGTSQHVCHHTLHAILTHVGVRPGVAEKHYPGYNWLPQCTWSLRHAHRRPCKSDRPHQGGVHVSLPARDRTLPPDAVSQVHMHFCVHETLTMWTVSINCMPGMGSWLQPVMPSCAQGWIDMVHRVAQHTCVVFPSSTLWVVSRSHMRCKLLYVVLHNIFVTS